ncbi:MAG: hypothetical protein HYW63_03000 [Candidatus Levybacteria bacterium]|nr:hypothetical protein [Candidatus Levybacteria bacterium]
MGRQDFEPRQTGQRPDLFRAGEFTRHDAAVIARMIADSPRHPYIDPTKVDKISVEPISGNGGSWFIADALRASLTFSINPRRLPPNQIPELMEAVKRDGERLANNEGHRQGLTTIPDTPELATMYRAQIRGTGVGSDMTSFFARDELPDVRDPRKKVTVLVVNAFRRNDEIGQELAKLAGVGYGIRESTNGKLRMKGKGKF